MKVNLRIASCKGQNLVEFGLIGVVVVIIAILGIVFFGDSLANVFDGNLGINVFKNSRVTNSDDPRTLLTGIKVQVGNKKYSAPIEEVIRRKLQAGSYIQTSGSSGSVREVTEVILEYVRQIREMLSDSNINNQELNDALAAYETAINNYVGLDNQVANDPNRRLANNLDIAVNLDARGNIATNFSNAIDVIISGITDETLKNTLLAYKNDMLNLGRSIDYTIDSRVYNEFGFSELQNELNENMLDIRNILNQLNTGDIEGLSEISPILANIKTLEDLRNLKISDINTINGFIQNFITNNPEYTFVNGDLYSLDSGLIKIENGSFIYETAQMGTLNFTETSNNPDTKTFNIDNCKERTMSNLYSGYSPHEGYEITVTINKNHNPPTVTINKTKYKYWREGDSCSGINCSCTLFHGCHVSSSDAGWGGAEDSNSYNGSVTISNDNILNRLKAKLDNLFVIAYKAKKKLSDEYGAMSDTEQAEMQKRIDVYRNGTYNEIAGETYNSKALCGSVNGSINDNTCSAQ